MGMRDGLRKGLRMIASEQVGFGLFGALVLLATHRSSPFVLASGLSSWAPFVFGFFGGLCVGGAALALLRARASGAIGTPASQRFEKARAALAACCLVAGVFSAAGAFSFGVDISALGMPWSFGGVIAGAATSALLAQWAERFGSLSRRAAFAKSGAACLVAAALSALAAVLPESAAFALVAVEAAAAAVLLFTGEPFGSPLPSDDATTSEDAAAHASSHASERAPGRSALAFAAAVWRPAAGALICLFVFGLTWDTDRLGAPLNDGALLAFEKVAGFAAAGLVVGLLARREGERDLLETLVGFVLPLLLVTFIVRPYLLDFVVDPIALGLIGFARETGFALFLAAAWLALSTHARACGLPPAFAMTLFAALAGASGLAGLYSLPVLGAASTFVGAVLFALYLVIVVVASMAQRGRLSARDAQAIERQGFERFIEARSDELAERFSLTPRERDIVVHLGRGHSYAYIAGELVVSENTVRTHVRNMYRKMGVSSREELLEMIHGA